MGDCSRALEGSAVIGGERRGRGAEGVRASTWLSSVSKSRVVSSPLFLESKLEGS